MALFCGGLTSLTSDLTQCVRKDFAMLELCGSMIHKTKLHERNDALKFSDLPLPFLCKSHSQAIKLINRIICNVQQRQRKRQRT